VASSSPENKADIRDDPLLRDVPEVDGFKVLDSCVLYVKVGKGGMGAVYRGKHIKLDIDVAVKCLLPYLAAGNDQMVLRFEREGRLAARVNHPNIVRVFDVDHRHSIHYLVMEYVKGETARERVGRKKGPLEVGEAVTIVLQAARGLAAAHREGIVHRDVKPDNILISTRGEVKLADLGLGCVREEAEPKAGLTVSDVAMGTPRYMPPEQWDGLLKVGPSGDVWALGATLYFLLVGKDAFGGNVKTQIMRRVCTEPFPDITAKIPDLPPGLVGFLRKCTEQEQEKRFRTGVDLVQALGELAKKHRFKGSLKDQHTGTGTSKCRVVSPPPPELLAKVRVQQAEDSKCGSQTQARALMPTAEHAPGIVLQAKAEKTDPGKRRPFLLRGVARSVTTLLLLVLALGWAGYAVTNYLASTKGNVLGLDRLFVHASTEARVSVPVETVAKEDRGGTGTATLEAPSRDPREEVDDLYQEALLELQKPGTLDAAARKLGRVLELVPKYPGARDHLGLVHRRLAERFQAQGNAAQAYREARRSLEINPSPLGRRLASRYEREITSAVGKGFRILEPTGGRALRKPTCVVRGAVEYEGIVHRVTVHGQPAKFAAGRFDAVVEGLSEGRQTIQIQVVLEGDDGPKMTKNLVLTLDTQPPELAVTSPEENTWQSSPCDVSGTVRDATAVTVLVNQLPVEVRGESWHLSVPLRDGEQTLVCEASDAAGGITRLTRTLRVDALPPQIEILEPRVARIEEKSGVDGVFVTRAETALVRVKATDEGELASVSIGGSVAPAGDAGNFQREVSLAEGKSRIEIVGLDRAGNEARRGFEVVCDRTPPLVTLDRTTEPFRPGKVSLSGTVEDSLAVSVVVNDQPARVKEGIWTIDVVLEKENPFLKVRARDEAGNESEPVVMSVSVGRERLRRSEIKGFTYVMRNGEGYPEYRQEGTDIIMVLLPGGTFWMGSTGDERKQVSKAIDSTVEDRLTADFLKKHLRSEAPRHRVTLDPFLVAKYEVSQDVWTQVMEQNASRFQGDRLPVENISWEEASEFCRRTGLALPSEAQWEYACRGETETSFAFGESIGTSNANFNGRYPYGGGPKGVYRQETVIVSSFQPNAFGLHNMHGNVSEWCADVFDERFYGEPAATARNPLLESDSKSVLRVCRGGSWAIFAWSSRSACRDGFPPNRRHYLRGFRPVYSLLP